MAGEWTVYPQMWQIEDAELASLERWLENLVEPRTDAELALLAAIGERVDRLKAAA